MIRTAIELKGHKRRCQKYFGVVIISNTTPLLFTSISHSTLYCSQGTYFRKKSPDLLEFQCELKIQHETISFCQTFFLSFFLLNCLFYSKFYVFYAEKF